MKIISHGRIFLNVPEGSPLLKSYEISYPIVFQTPIVRIGVFGPPFTPPEKASKGGPFTPPNRIYDWMAWKTSVIDHHFPLLVQQQYTQSKEKLAREVPSN